MEIPKYLTFPITVPLLLTGCLELGNSGLPEPGDVVSPRLVREIQWAPGEEGELWVDLSATNAAGRTRSLSFAASPQTNPVAHVRFYNAEGNDVASREVELSVRC